jgi:transposase-like protein
MPVPRAKPIDLTNQQRQDLLRLARAHSTPRSLAFRARIVLRAADADRPTNLRIAAELGCDDDTVRSWRRRFAERGLDGLLDLPRSGRPPAFPPRGPAPRP